MEINMKGKFDIYLYFHFIQFLLHRQSGFEGGGERRIVQTFPVPQLRNVHFND